MGVSQCLFFDSLGFDAAWQTSPFGSRLRIVPVYIPSGSLRPQLSPRSCHTSPTPDLGNGNNHSSGKNGTGKYSRNTPHLAWHHLIPQPGHVPRSVGVCIHTCHLSSRDRSGLRATPA
ncbi:hypothetical protein FKM82_024419 [Ascaphus truei]